jgi:hypothetical protein
LLGVIGYLMDYHIKELIVHNLLANRRHFYYDRQLYVVKNPSLDILLQADEIYRQCLIDNKYIKWLRLSNCEKLLKVRHLWSDDMSLDMKAMEARLDNVKITLYKNFYRKDVVNRTKKEIANLNKNMNKLYNILHSLDQYTIEYYASILKMDYILQNCLYCNNRLVGEIAGALSNSLLSEFNFSLLSTSNIREIARSEPWNSYYRINVNPFTCSIAELNDTQKTLLSYSQMYSSIYENPNRPDDGIIQDDDALDGWMLNQKIERDKERQENNTQNITKKNNADEIFLPAYSGQDIIDIRDLNTQESENVKKQKFTAIQKAGSIEDGDLPDRQAQMRATLIAQRGH